MKRASPARSNCLATSVNIFPTGDDIGAKFTAGETPSLKEIIKFLGLVREARAAAWISRTGAAQENLSLAEGHQETTIATS